MIINSDKKFLSVAEVAELLGCDKHQIYKVIKSGELRSVKVGKTIIAVVWLEEFLTSQATNVKG
ncbi:MAG: helix-turn-helix domain-containing protein [Eubacterium sp.]